jgi:hypothetical protein
MEQYLGNVSMKIHAKACPFYSLSSLADQQMGGVTHEVNVSNVIDKKTMLIGADVSSIPESKSFC